MLEQDVFSSPDDLRILEDYDNIQHEIKSHHFDFSKALSLLKSGKHVAREGWNASGLFVTCRLGGSITLNESTATALGMPVGSVCKFRPYFLIYTRQRDFATWVPTNSDIFADDWLEV